MNKKLVALAVTAAVAAPGLATAQTASVTLYGRLYPEFGVARTTGATRPGTSVSTLSSNPSGENLKAVHFVDAANSRLGFRGEENLGGGLKAIFQIEQRVSIDAGGAALASRDSFVGLLSDAWGSIRLGNMDTVYKTTGDTLSFLGISSGNFVSVSNVLSKSNLTDGNAASFHRRQANSIRYESPEFAGFQAGIQHSPDEAETSTKNADLWSGGIWYQKGPVYLGLAYERHNDFFGGSAGSRSSLRNTAAAGAQSKDEAVRLTAQYKFGAHTIEGNVARLRYKEWNGPVGRFSKYESDHWSLSWDARWGGPWRTAVSYAGSNDGKCSLIGGAACSTDGLSGSMLAVGGYYAFSRRTNVFLIASKLWNDKSARFSNLQVNEDVSAGADVEQVAIGISHSF